MSNSQPYPIGAIGRLMRRKDELSQIRLNPKNDTSSSPSYLSSPLETDWDADKKDNMLSKLMK